jgi:hypothetical protein
VNLTLPGTFYHVEQMKAAEIENRPGVETPLDIEQEIRQGLDEFSLALTEFGSARFDQSELSFINSIVG